MLACTDPLTVLRNVRDTLQRHLSVHAKTDDKRLPTAGSNRRVTHACQNCSQSKLRCDGKNPCNRCLSKSSACWYGTSRSSKVSEQPESSALNMPKCQSITELDRKSLNQVSVLSLTVKKSSIRKRFGRGEVTMERTAPFLFRPCR